MRDNIFTGLENENTMTELLCNFLRHKPFRELFLNLSVKDNLTDDLRKLIMSIDYENFDTQYMLNNKGRPDFVIISDDVDILFEVKISVGTSLTENQPAGYLEYLKSSKKSVKLLCFILPEGYDTTQLKGEGTIRSHYIFWNDIIGLIEDNELCTLNPFFEQYHAWLCQNFIHIPMSFTEDEISLMHNFVPSKKGLHLSKEELSYV